MKHILLVDDNETFCRSLAEILRRAGYEVRTAAEGSAALRLFREEPADLVITDLIMPGKEGLETIIELRQIRSSVRIIAISGGGRIDPGDYLPMAQQLGANRTLAKPFTSEQILDLVGESFAESN
jgi:CheY-like chemotaxis protein